MPLSPSLFFSSSFSAIPFRQRDTEYSLLLLRGDLPWLSVIEEPAQSVWRLWIVAQAPLQTARRFSGAYDHAEALPCRPHRSHVSSSTHLWEPYFQCTDKTWECRHDESFLMSYLMPELWKSMVFDVTKKYKFFTACFFFPASAAFERLCVLLRKLLAAKIAAPEQW